MLMGMTRIRAPEVSRFYNVHTFLAVLSSGDDVYLGAPLLVQMVRRAVFVTIVTLSERTLQLITDRSATCRFHNYLA
jgi:hypothetical protein